MSASSAPCVGGCGGLAREVKLAGAERFWMVLPPAVLQSAGTGKRGHLVSVQGEGYWRAQGVVGTQAMAARSSGGSRGGQRSWRRVAAAVVRRGNGGWSGGG